MELVEFNGVFVLELLPTGLMVLLIGFVLFGVAVDDGVEVQPDGLTFPMAVRNNDLVNNLI